MNGFKTVEKLKELEKKATPGKWGHDQGNGWNTRDLITCADGAILWGKIENDLDGDLIADLRNAAPLLLDIAEQIRPGDAEILYWMLTGIGDEPDQDDIAGLLSRYHTMAERMHESR